MPIPKMDSTRICMYDYMIRLQFIKLKFAILGKYLLFFWYSLVAELERLVAELER